jgi:hypothetical protein
MADLDIKLDAPEGCSIQSTTLEANHILHVTAVDGTGKSSTASIDLDTFIGNNNGALSLGLSGFSVVARNVTLSEDGQSLDAELPDANGDFSTSSVSIAHGLGTVGGQPRLLMDYAFIHSTAHANANSTAEADAQIKGQVQVIQPHINVDHVVTLSCADEYGLDNPNAEWTKQNLGPYGGKSSRRGPVALEGTRLGLTLAESSMEIAEGCCVM